MSIYSDNQTKHFYVASANATNNTINGVVKDLEDSDLFRIILNQDNGNKVTSDVINRKLIKKIKINEVEPTYFRKCNVGQIAETTPTVGSKYYVYFYLENMLGFGMQDRWDRVAEYTVKAEDVATGVTTKNRVMEGLALDLHSKLNAAGPIAGDFMVSIGNVDLNKTNMETYNAYRKGTGTDPFAGGGDLVVREYKDGPSFKGGLTVTDLRMHTNPYTYHVTMSTGKSLFVAATTTTPAYYNELVAWDENRKQIPAEKPASPTTDDIYISSATKVMDMELYFLRNRGDLYDLTKDFGASILNTPQVLTNNATYYTLDIDYAFSDTQGYTYHSDKQLSIACSNKQALQAFKLNILNDNNESAYSASNSVTYTHTNDDDD